MEMRSHSIVSEDIRLLIQAAAHCIDAGRLYAAADIYEDLLQKKPGASDLHHTLGLVYLEIGRLDRAIFHIEQSIHLNPLYSIAYRSLGDAYQDAGRLDKALLAYQKALALNPEEPDATINLGNVLHRMDRFQEALACYREVIDRIPNHLMALNNIAKTFQDMGQLDQALEYYNRCVQIDPNYAEARFNRATALLTLGKYQDGWTEYEWRFRRRNAHKVYPHRLTTPRWQGGPYAGQRLLVHCEQGMGDVLQFARYLPRVKQLGGTLILEAHPPLLPLLASMRWADELLAFHPERPPTVPHDFHIPLLSLPNVFNTTFDSIPSAFPYLQCDHSNKVKWQERISAGEIAIGLVWESSALNPRRNCPLKRCGCWFQIPGLQFYGIQTGAAAAQLRHTPANGNGPIISLGEHFRDFSDTAAAISSLDLLISVDTAAAHLAGAMGKPVWVLLPKSTDWRWPPGFPDSLWYAGARLFRQTETGNWDTVIADVTRALEQLPATRERLHPAPQDAIEPSDFHLQSNQLHRVPGYRGMRSKIADGEPGRQPRPDYRCDMQPTWQRRGRSTPKIKKILLISPILGGSLEVIRFLHSGFLQAGVEAQLIDNSTFYPAFEKIDRSPYDQEVKEQMFGRLIDTIDEGLMACVQRCKPDLIMAVAQSPVNDQTILKLKAKGIPSAYWFVEDYRFRQYWSQKASVFDYFFTIQRDGYLKARFQAMGHKNWHYLPLGCDPMVHKPWRPSPSAQQPFRCRIGFMGAPYRNRIKVFESLSHLDLGIWGQGWNNEALSPGLRACIREGHKRITSQESVKIYCSADIVLNLHSSPFTDGISADGDFVNPRTFEVAACGGFQLTDHRKELGEVFSLGEEIVVFHDLEELGELIAYWSSHPRQREIVAQKACQRAWRDHTYKIRAGQIIATIEANS